MKRTLIAAAVLIAASGSAFAHQMKDPYIFNATEVGEQVGLEGWVTLWGCVHVSSSAGAVINNNQMVDVNASLTPQAQSYAVGRVTTSYDNSVHSVSGTGANSTYNYSAFGTASQGMSTHTSSSSDMANSTTTKSSSSSYGYGNQKSYGEASAFHASGDNGSTHSSTISGGLVASDNSGYTNTSGKSGNWTGSASQGAAGTVTVSGSESHYGRPGNGGASATLSGSEGTAVTASTSYDKNNASYGTHSSGVIASINGSLTTTNANSGYADGSQSYGAAEQDSGSGWKAKTSTDTYAHNSSSTKTESQSGSSSYSTASGSAHAWGYNVNDSLNTTNEVTTGSVTQVTNTQVAGTLNATTGTGAASSVSGNLGINIGEGIDNAQSNDVSLASVDIGNVFGNAQVFNTQESAGSAKIKNFNLNASIGDSSLQNVSGNVGVNVASGIGNVQNNSLAGAVTTTSPGNALTTAMVATDDNSQTANMSVSGQFQGTAMLGNNALTGSQGNIGVNIAGGAGNLQHNGLAIAALNSGH
jgi:hypothetical protein